MIGPEVGIRFTLPVKTKSKNRSWVASMQGRMAEAGLTKNHRALAKQAAGGHLNSRGLKGSDFVPVVVTLTRISAGTLDDDNLIASMKGLRDGLADALAINDADVGRLRFAYLQRKGRPREYGVEVLIERDPLMATTWKGVPFHEGNVAMTRGTGTTTGEGEISVSAGDRTVTIRVPADTPAEEIAKMVVKQLRAQR